MINAEIRRTRRRGYSEQPRDVRDTLLVWHGEINLIASSLPLRKLL